MALAAPKARPGRLLQRLDVDNRTFAGSREDPACHSRQPPARDWPTDAGASPPGVSRALLRSGWKSFQDGFLAGGQTGTYPGTPPVRAPVAGRGWLGQN